MPLKGSIRVDLWPLSLSDFEEAKLSTNGTGTDMVGI